MIFDIFSFVCEFGKLESNLRNLIVAVVVGVVIGYVIRAVSTHWSIRNLKRANAKYRELLIDLISSPSLLNRTQKRQAKELLKD